MYSHLICLTLVVYAVTAETVLNVTEAVPTLPDPKTDVIPSPARQQRQFLISPPTFRKRQPAKKTKTADNPAQRRIAYNMPQPRRGHEHRNAPAVMLGGFRGDNPRRKVLVRNNLTRRQFPAPVNLQGYYVNIQPYRAASALTARVKGTKSDTRKSRPRKRFMPAGLMS